MLQVVPGVRIAAPRDEPTLRGLLRQALDVEDAPTVVRFPKGALGPPVPALRSTPGFDVIAESGEPDVLLISVGVFAAMAVEVAERLRAQGIGCLTVDPGWVTPVHEDIVTEAARFRLVVVVEDGVRNGGVGASISRALQDSGIDVPVRTIGIPARFLDHGKRAQVLADCGLTAQDVSRRIVETIAGAADSQVDAAAPTADQS
jgi:1-deoxy-D-xylulose-5-phosphate synthase